jgi:hypothetical protein
MIFRRNVERQLEGDGRKSTLAVEDRLENPAAFHSKDARMLIKKLTASFQETDFPNSCVVEV